MLDHLQVARSPALPAHLHESSVTQSFSLIVAILSHVICSPVSFVDSVQSHATPGVLHHIPSSNKYLPLTSPYDDMAARNYTVKTHIFPGQHIRHYAHATRSSEESVFQLQAKQYIPRSNIPPSHGAITIIALPAGSFPKEILEPLWDAFLTHSKTNNFSIRSIWALDPSTQAASGVLNESIQGDDPSIHDTARDVLCMVSAFRLEMPQPIIGFGHSLGGTAMLSLATMHPRLMASMILVDPTSGPSIQWAGGMLTFAASVRPDLWPSRKAAEKHFRKGGKAMSANWDPRCLDLFLRYGLRETPTLLYPEANKVTLKTSKAQEAWSYSQPCFELMDLGPGEPLSGRLEVKYTNLAPLDDRFAIFSGMPMMRTEGIDVDEALPSIRPDVLYVFPEEGPLRSGYADKLARTGVGAGGSGGQRAGRIASETIAHAGHLVVMEKPAEVGKTVAEWLGQDVAKWAARKEVEGKERDDKSVDGKQLALSEKWMEQSFLLFQLVQQAKERSKKQGKRAAKL